MAGENTVKYRKRIEDDSGQIAKDDTRPKPGANLAFQKLDERADVRLAAVSVADQMLPKDVLEPASLDFGAGLLLAEERNKRLRELLERAQSLISRGDYRPALGMIEEALSCDRISGMAWAFKARCLAELKYYEAALRVFVHAREQVSDPDLRILVLRWEADCVQASTRAMESEFLKLVEKRQLPEALSLISSGLRRQPSNIVFLYHRANLHWVSGERELALQTLEEARRHMGRESIDLIMDLERKIEFGAHRQTVEAARIALRRSDSSEAFRHLDSCAAQLRDNEHYEGLRAYAERKRRTLGQLLGRNVPAQAPSALQQTMRWILNEEIHQAEEALGASDYARARSVLEQAANIENGCAAVCYMHARAVFEICRQAGSRATPGDLKQAATLAVQAAADQDYHEPANGLARKIRELRTRLGC